VEVRPLGKQGLITEYPPKDWVCPSCGKEHSGSHYSIPGQIDYTKKPGEKGRILFNRRGKDDNLTNDTPIDNDKPVGGEQLDEIGTQRPLFCPHCGYEDEIIVALRMGDLPDLVDRFFQEEGVDPKKTWRKLLSEFLSWFKKREAGQ